MKFRLPAFDGLFGGESELVLDPPEMLWSSGPALGFEVRPNDDGSIDEVLIYAGDRCVFHLEQTNSDAYWFAWYGHGIDRDRHFDIRRHKKRVEITER